MATLRAELQMRYLAILTLAMCWLGCSDDTTDSVDDNVPCDTTDPQCSSPEAGEMNATPEEAAPMVVTCADFPDP